ncbi:MAG: hypothetical protein ACFCUI_03480 [Bernardetiaceae bacterium]
MILFLLLAGFFVFSVSCLRHISDLSRVVNQHYKFFLVFGLFLSVATTWFGLVRPRQCPYAKTAIQEKAKVVHPPLDAQPRAFTGRCGEVSVYRCP